jgi:flagellar assembly protein FliH
MSSRAQRVRASVVIQPFDWGREPAEPEADVMSPPPPIAMPSRPEVDERWLADVEREAFTKGYAQGERSGEEAATVRAEAVLWRLTQTLEELGTLREQMIHKTERQVVQLALAIAARIIHREVAVDQELLVAMARVALDRLGDRASATIRLNPQDFAAAGVDRLVGKSAVQIVADASVNRGGCRVESDFGLIDVAVAAQLAEITTALLGDEAGLEADAVYVQH